MSGRSSSRRSRASSSTRSARHRPTRGRPFSPQTRDMNPIYTGKDVSFIDTKQAQRIAENTLLGAEKFATIAGLLGARFPTEAIDKAWRQLLFGAHHDGITGSESDQVYLDLLGGWREAVELGKTVLDGALDYLGAAIETAGDGRAVTVFNALSWPRTDIARVDDRAARRRVARDRAPGRRRRASCRSCSRPPTAARTGGPPARPSRSSPRDVPALGYRTFRAMPSATPLDESGMAPDRRAGDRERRVRACRSIQPAAARIASLVDKRSGKELVQAGRGRQRAARLPRVPEPPAVRGRPVAPDPRWTVHVGDRLRGGGHGRGIADRPADPARGPVRGVAPRPGDPAVGGRRAGRADHVASRLPRPGPPVPGPVPGRRRGRRAGLGGRQRRHRPAVRAARTSTSPRSRSRSIIRPTTGSRWVPPPGSRSGRATGRRPVPRRARASRAIGVAEVVVPDDARQDAAVRDLVIALVRQGVTSTLSRDDGHRYGVLHIDSNLPDVRLAVGRAEENSFVGAVLDAADADYRAELDRQLAAQGWARLWVPEDGVALERSEPIPDLRGARDLPVLIVAGVDPDATTRALEAVSADLEDGVIVGRPAGGARRRDGAYGGLHRRDPQPGDARLQRRGGRQPVPLAHAVVQRLAVRRLDRPAAAGDAGRSELPVPALEPPLRVRGRGRRRGLARWRHRAGRTRLQQSARSTGFRQPSGPSARNDKPHRGRAPVRGHDRPEAGRRRGDADGRDGRRSRCRPRSPALRVVGPTDDGHDPQSLADRLGRRHEHPRGEHAAAGSVGDDGKRPARAVRDRDGRGNAGGARRRGSERR